MAHDVFRKTEGFIDFFAEIIFVVANLRDAKLNSLNLPDGEIEILFQMPFLIFVYMMCIKKRKWY